MPAEGATSMLLKSSVAQNLVSNNFSLESDNVYLTEFHTHHSKLELLICGRINHL